MKKLSTIQKNHNLNSVYVLDEPGVGGASHYYQVMRNDNDEPVAVINFQHGPRKEADATHGVLDCDLLEIVRDRLIHFQQGEFATRENDGALTHIEMALLWMSKRVEDRAERNVLGTTQQ